MEVFSVVFQVRRADISFLDTQISQYLAIGVLTFLSGVIVPLAAGLAMTSDPQDGDFFGFKGFGGPMCTFWAVGLIISCVFFFILFPRWYPHGLIFLLPSLSSLGFIITLGLLNPDFYDIDYFITFLWPIASISSPFEEIFYLIPLTFILGAFFMVAPFISVAIFVSDAYFKKPLAVPLFLIPLTVLMSACYYIPTYISIKKGGLMHPPDWIFRPLFILLALGYSAFLYYSWATVITA